MLRFLIRSFPMLRFDLPQIPANAARADAFVTWCAAGLALLGLPYLMPLLAIQGFIRGFFRHGLEPVHKFVSAQLVAGKRGGKLEDAGAKMFANKILFVAATVTTVLWLLGSSMWMVPAGVLFVFSFLEWALSFCAGCWAYSAYYRFKPGQ
jgi:Domain of unknown function (DUF4395)